MSLEDPTRRVEKVVDLRITQPVINEIADPPGVNEVPHSQDRELLRNARTLHSQLQLQLADTLLTITQEFQDANPAGVSQRFKELCLEALKRLCHQVLGSPDPELRGLESILAPLEL